MSSNNTPLRPRIHSSFRDSNSSDPATNSRSQSHLSLQDLILPYNEAIPFDESTADLYSVSLSLQPESSSSDLSFSEFSLPTSIFSTSIAPPFPLSPISSSSVSLDRPHPQASEDLDAHLFGTNTQGRHVLETYADTVNETLDEQSDADNSSSQNADFGPPTDSSTAEDQEIQSTNFETAVDGCYAEEYSNILVVAQSHLSHSVPDISSMSVRRNHPSSSNNRKRSLRLVQNIKKELEIGTTTLSVLMDAKDDADTGSARSNESSPPPGKKLCDNSRGKRSNDQL